MFAHYSHIVEEHEKKIRDLQLSLQAKEDMIGRKQAELSRANQKHYELEQELAFYKIDTKFTSLHKKPETPSVIVSLLKMSVHRLMICDSLMSKMKMYVTIDQIRQHNVSKFAIYCPFYRHTSCDLRLPTHTMPLIQACTTSVLCMLMCGV